MIIFLKKDNPLFIFVYQYQTSSEVSIINYQYSVFRYPDEIFEKPLLQINSKRGPPKMIKNKFKFKMI